MNRFAWHGVGSAASFLVFVPAVWSQVSPPDIGYVYPAGAQQGTTVEVKLAGQYLDGATALRISGEGVQWKIVGQTRPLTPREIGELRRKLQDLENKEKKTDDDRKEIAEIRKKLVPPAIRPTPVLAEIVTVELTIDPKATPGPRQLRVRANTGMSNPVVFMIGQLPEVAQQKGLIDPESETPRDRAEDFKVNLPATLNSQIMPGQVDRYRFSASKGQHLVFVTRARALIPYLADAVPGWFQAVLTLYDGDGNEVAFKDQFHYQPDPVLAYKVPKDGEYVLEIRDALFRGREDFVYRIEAGELPFVTSIFPLGGPAKTRTTVNLEGWNLSKTSLTLEPADMVPGIVPLTVRHGDFVSNRVPFAVDTVPESNEKEPNHSIATAQPLTLPVIVNGRISKPGTWDVYRFDGWLNQTIIAEVRARRLGSPLDSVLKLTDASGKVLAFNDDWEDKGQGLHTHHADSQIRFTLPATGTYYLFVGDTQGQGSPAHAYRLRVSQPQPDFELRVTPCSINARPGTTVTITVHALRKDGFTGEINLFLTYSPVDFALGGARIPANQDVVRVTVQVPATVRPTPINLVLEGRATIQGQKLVRVATPAEEMMQAFAYHHLVPARDLMVTISGNARSRFPARVLNNGPIRIPAGGTGQIFIAIPKAASGNKIQLVLNDPPEGITLKKSVITEEGAILLIEADAEKVKPGFRANLIVEAYPESAKPGGSGRMAQSSLGTLPAIPFEILRTGR